MREYAGAVSQIELDRQEIRDELRARIPQRRNEREEDERPD
jgi:hypothetical protein